MALSCKLSIPEVPGLESQQLTVGRHFFFVCEGDTGNFDFAKAQLVTLPEAKYEFALVRATPNQTQPTITFDMVSYIAGEIKTTELKFTDGAHEVMLKVDPIKVHSVLPEPQKNAEGQVQPPEPYGFNLSNLHWPLSYTVFFILVFCAVLAGIILQINKARRWRRLSLELKDYESAMAPDSQFYKHLRQLEKQNYPMAAVERQFHIYVIRRYQVPLFGLSPGETQSYLKKKWPTLVSERRDLKNILADLKKMATKDEPEATKRYLNKLYQFVDDTEEKLGNLSTGGLL